MHDGILKLASDACVLMRAVGHPLQTCPEFVVQFGEPLFKVVEEYLITKDRICNEKLGYCRNPVITEINLDTVVDNILATKPVSLANDDYIQNMYA